MKSCELCKSPARIYCDSDQASLCWTCDSKVHSANFLVARHSRSLLCRVCQSPTPWTASGEKLGPSAVSVCEKCTSDDDREESHGEIDDDDNQVVPLCTTPPPAASSSSSDDLSVVDETVLMKRKRENVAVHLSSSEDDVECISVKKLRPFYEFLPPNSQETTKSVVVGFDLNTSIISEEEDEED